MLSFFNSSNFDKFIIYGSAEVNLYELKEKNHVPDFIFDSPKLQNISNSVKILLSVGILRICFVFSILGNLKFISQHDNTITFLKSEQRYQYIKCAVPSHHQDSLLVACGLAIGKVSVINFDHTFDNYLEFSEILI
jgi:hypothetical protein